MHLYVCVSILSQAYAACLNSKSKFYYTLTFLLIPLLFYTTEFLTLRPEYEPTGLRAKLKRYWGLLTASGAKCAERTCNGLLLLWYFLLTIIALILWQPVTACCKFYRDARYKSSKIWVQHTIPFNNLY